METGIQYENKEIPFKIVRSNRRKTVGIYIDPKVGVVVRSPRFLKIDEIYGIVRKKAEWILEKQRLVKSFAHFGSAKEFVSGEAFPYLGREYRLKVRKSGLRSVEQCKLINGRFVVEVDERAGAKGIKKVIRRALENWYIERARDKIPERVRLYAHQMGKWPQSVVIKNHKRRWGSCSHDGVVRFNWKVIMAPITILDYVIVHELCHLIHPNHSPLFWQKVHTVIPDYLKRRNTLREYSLRADIFD